MNTRSVGSFWSVLLHWLHRPSIGPKPLVASRESLVQISRRGSAVESTAGGHLETLSLVIANQYRWCSARWHERTASAAQVKTIYGFPVTELKVKDDDDVAMS